jgi:hypothetical protein
VIFAISRDCGVAGKKKQGIHPALSDIAKMVFENLRPQAPVDMDTFAFLGISVVGEVAQRKE